MFTELALKALPTPTKGQKIYRDKSTPGFGVRVSQGGAKTFVLVHGQDKRLITIGRHGVISLAQARTEARRLLAEFTLGRIRPQSVTYQQAAELFLADKAKARRKTTVYGYKLLLARLNFKCQLADITPHEFARRMARFKTDGMYSHILVTAKTFFKWCQKRRYIEHDPTLGLTKPKTRKLTRLLTDDELRAIWAATEEPTNFNRIIRVALLSGQRRGELAQFKPEWLDGDLCTTPSDVSKNHIAHTWPIGPLVPQFLPLQPFNNWGAAKADLDAKCGVTGWTIHTLRHTFKSIHSRIGTPPHISERLLNHITAQSEMERTYDRHRYLDEMRGAVLAYQNHLSKLLNIN